MIEQMNLKRGDKMRLTNEVMRSDVKKTIYGYMNMLTKVATGVVNKI